MGPEKYCMFCSTLFGSLPSYATNLWFTTVVHKEHAPDPAAVASGEVQYEPPKPLVRPEDLRLRSERQTLRRMPRTGAILFTVRT